MTGQQRNQALFIADAIRGVFGINSPIYIPWGKNVPYEAGEYPNIQFLPEETILEDMPVSEFGTNVFGSITFESGEYNMYDIDGSLIKRRFGDYALPYSCITTFRRPSNVTKTEVLGSSGTVKEFYGKSDWQLSIRGVAFNRRDGRGVSAHEQIDNLTKWADICDSIGVLGSIFRRKGIYNIVIEEFSEQPIVGRWDAIPFQIDAVSDNPIELYLP